MESPRTMLNRALTRVDDRRGALAALAAASGLTLLGSHAAAADDDLTAEGKRRGKRGKRGKHGAPGQPGKQGPPAGAGAEVVKQECTLPGLGGPFSVGDTTKCTAECASGFTAVGGGFLEPKFIDSLGYVRGSYPNADSGAATGWTVEIEFLDVGQSFNATAYAVCLPTE